MTIRQQWSIVGLFVLLIASGLFAATRIFGDDTLMAAIASPCASRMGAPKQQPSSTLSSSSVL